MPEYKKADSALTNYQSALSQRYQDMTKELNEKDSALSSPDTIRLTKEQIEVRKKAKEHGYTYVLLKESIAVYPLTDDLMPYAKQKLGLK